MIGLHWQDLPSITRGIAIRFCRREGGNPDNLFSCGSPEWAAYILHALDAQKVLIDAGLISADEIERGMKNLPSRVPDCDEWRPNFRTGDFLRMTLGGAVLALIVFASCWVIPTLGVLLEAAHGP